MTQKTCVTKQSTCTKWIVPPLTLKPTNFYNTEKHVKRTLILQVNYACCAHITDFGLIAYQRIFGSFYTQNQSLYNKLSFHIKSLLYKEELTPYKAMDFTHHLIIQYNSCVTLHNYPPFCLT